MDLSPCMAQSPWTQKQDMPEARGWHSSCVLDGKIYAIGGLTSTDGTAHKTVQVYDPDLNSWTTKTAMNEGRASFPTCVVNGKIWAIGGASKLWYSSRKSIEEYNPATNTWTRITDMRRARARQGHTASLVDGKIFIIGGGTNWETAIAEVDVYDTLTKNWTTVSPMPTPRMYLKAVVLNDTIYTIGGNEGAKNNETSVPTVQAYHPATDTWKEKASMITPRRYFSASVINDKIYVIGGKIGGHGVTTFTTHVEEYDPETNTWIEMSELPEKYLRAHSANTFNGKIFVVGGVIYKPPPPIFYRKVYTYNPHHDLLPLIEKTEVDKGYVKPGIDSVCITAKMNDTTGIILLAIIKDPDGISVDSLQLFDDGKHDDGYAGDSIYANVWPSFADEAQYSVDIRITCIETDTAIHQLKNLTAFTTIGPVTYAGYEFVSGDTIFDPNENQPIKLRLKNNSTTTAAKNITAKLTSTDTLVLITSGFRTIGDIAAGENSTSEGTYWIYIPGEYQPNTEIDFNIEIASDGYIFWTDTFSIVVAPTNIEDIRVPINRIYPNPASGQLMIEFDKTIDKKTSIVLFDITGKVLYSEIKDSAAPLTHTINLSALAEGLYLISISNNEYSYTEKVIKVE